MADAQHVAALTTENATNIGRRHFKTSVSSDVPAVKDVGGSPSSGSGTL